MRGRFSQYGARYMLGLLVAPDNFPPVEGLYVGFCNRVPNDGDTGNTLTEPTPDQGYSRAYYPMGDAYWDIVGYGTFWNIKEVVFTTSTDIWSRLGGFFLATAVTGGDLFAYGPTSVNRVPEGVQLVVPPGAMQLTLRGAAL